MDGILIVDKSQGMTSHDVVNLIRNRFGLKKVGHAGTLDPMATGVLVMLIGAYTKSANLFLNQGKEYECRMVLGAVSDTHDAWGKVKILDPVIDLDERKITDVFKEFVGETEQFPPMYSAVKFKGKKLYEFARRGIKVEMAPRKISIKSLDILKISLPEVSFKVECSKGTYVRQLCSDIGEKLRCGAYLSYLRRLRSGRFFIKDAVKIDEIEKIESKDLENRLYRI